MKQETTEATSIGSKSVINRVAALQCRELLK